MPEKPWLRTEPPRPRRELVEDFADDADTTAFLRSAGKNRRIRKSIIPTTKWGRIGAGVGAAAVLAAIGGGLWATMHFFTHDERFRIPSSQSIEIAGNSHITRSQLLSIFGEDVERNVFHVPLAQRKAELEQMPWVERATVMRLLPNRIRVQVIERTPIAFVRQGGDIGMVDANGVLLDIPPDAPGNPHYSFPVVTGIKANEPMSTRAPRMKLYQRFLQDLDSGGQKVSSTVSEVDLSDPEDVKALIPEGGIEVLAHFGQEDFQKRYQRLQDHINEWKGMYPRLSGVDLRYDRQVVLQVPQGGASAAAQAAVAPVDSAALAAAVKKQEEEAKAATAAIPAKHEAAVAGPASDTAKAAHTAKQEAAKKLAEEKKAAAKSAAMMAKNHPAPVANHSASAPAHAAAKPPVVAHDAGVKPSGARPVTIAPAMSAPVSASNALTHADVATAVPATGKKLSPKEEAERAKRVAAIHAWMEKREAARKAAHPAQ